MFPIFFGALLGFSVSLLGWQLNLIVLHRGIRKGRTSAFMTGAGASLSDFLLLLLGFSSARSFLKHFPFWNQLKWGGIVMLFLMALKILFHKPVLRAHEPEVKNRRLASSFFIGLIMVLGNPAVAFLWIMASAYLLAHFPEAHNSVFQMIFCSAFLIGALLWFVILSVNILPTVKTWKESTLHLLSRISAILLLVALVFLIFKKF